MQINKLNPIITDAKKARGYIKQFSKDLGRQIDYVDTPSRRIVFKTMSDDDAIFIANEFQAMTSQALKER